MNTSTQKMFCLKCGNLMKSLNQTEWKCSVCGHHHFLNPVTANGVILVNQAGQIGLVKRAIDPGKGLWDFAGGFVEIEENLEESMLRELQEELGFKAQPYRH